MIEQELIQKSQAIFDDLDKWKAICELHRFNSAIIEHWLGIGTKRLREHFVSNPSDGWRWGQWGAPLDTRWYLEKYGFDSLAIGFGWKYQFHLYLIDSKRFNSELIDAQLRTTKYAKLLMPFGVQSKVSTSPSKAMEEHFNFTFGSPNDGDIPLAELAWYAAHQTEDFVKQAAAKIEEFSRDIGMTQLLSDLNEMADSQASDRRS